MFSRSQSVNAIVVPEKQDQLEKRKEKLSRHALLRRSAPSRSCSFTSSITESENETKQQTKQQTKLQKRSRGTKQIKRQRSIPTEIEISVPLPLPLPLPSPTSASVSRWDSHGVAQTAKDQAFGCGLDLRQSSPALKARKGRIVRPNRGPPRMPQKQESVDRSL